MLGLKSLAICNFSITNVCNAACEFCGFAIDKMPSGAARYVDADVSSRALQILHRRGIRYVTLQGGASRRRSPRFADRRGRYVMCPYHKWLAPAAPHHRVGGSWTPPADRLSGQRHTC